MADSKPLLSALRYPGSKRRLVGYVKQALELNGLRPALYVEPFVGGASVALQLMQDDVVDKVVLADLDPWITSFWYTVFFDTDWLVEQVQNVEVSLAQWDKFKKSDPATPRDQALTCLFLNRTSFSGILEASAGPLGGRTQASEYKIDCRFPRARLVRRIKQAGEHQTQVYGVWNLSWNEAIARIRQEQRRGQLPGDGLFFYFDPPFFEKAEALYRMYFDDQGHSDLRDFVLTLTDSWILSYDSAEQVETLYGEAIRQRTNGTQQHHLDLSYTLAVMSAKRKQGREVIISNLPKLPPPAEIK